MALPTREIPAATVRESLRNVERLAILERPVYASRADWDFWRVVQVVGDGLRQEAEMPIGGVVLLLDRSSGTWRAIYDVPGASGKRSDFRLLGMIVEDDRLYAGMCYSDCGHWGAYERVAIDLRTNRVTLVGTDDGIEDEKPAGPGPRRRDLRRRTIPVLTAHPSARVAVPAPTTRLPARLCREAAGVLLLPLDITCAR